MGHATFSLLVMGMAPGQGRPRTPIPPAGEDGGAALIFILLVLTSFALLVALIGSAFTLLVRAVARPERAANVGFALAVPIALFLLWFLWEPLRSYLAPASGWAWVALLAIFLVVVVVALLSVAFSRENLGTTATLLLVVGGTLFFRSALGWGFWPSLGAAFAGSILVGLCWLAMAKLVERVRAR